ncbi:hypothetical protein CcaverHIS631_0402780 [Cutaneotrichosporon cavernicola]|nr:hypothetical protein CcaverHIS631_0402780 [Cutaneotrichosporon cavernicola]
MQQSKRRAPPPPLNLRSLERPQPSFRRSPRFPPPTPPPRTPLPSLPLLTPPHTPCSSHLRLPADRCPSLSSCASPLSVISPTYLEPRDLRRQPTLSRRASRRAPRESLVALPTKFHEDDDGLHPFARVDDADTLYSPTSSTYSSATAVSGVDARIADLEAQLRALQERLEPELRTTKSMPFLRRLQRKDDRQAKEFMALVEAKEFMALVEAKRNGKPIRDKEERPSARALLLGRAGASTIDLSHLEVKDKEKRRWNIWYKIRTLAM